MLGNFVAEQHRRALSLDVAEIRPVLGIADEGCEFRREGARDGRWIDQPLQLERFQPAEAVADDHTAPGRSRSEEHRSELQSLMRISYAVFGLKKKKAQLT